MKKKISLILLSVGLFSTLIPIATATSATNPSANSSCATKGQVVVYSNMKYTCVLSGKKLVWSAGVKVSALPTTTTSQVSTTTIANEARVYLSLIHI